MYYPLFIDFKNKKVLVLGGGKVGSRRALYLLKAGAIVTVISKEFDKKLKNKKLKLIKKDIKNLKIDFKKYFLIIITTNDKKINESISKRIKNKTLVCRADKHSVGDVVFPAYIVKKGIGITSFGKDTKKIKKIFENVRKT